MRRFLKSKAFWAIAICIVAIVVILIAGGLGKKKNYADKYKDLDMSKLVSEGRQDTYEAYLARHKGASMPTESIVVPMDKSSVGEFDAGKVVFDHIDGVDGNDPTVATYEGGYVEFKVNVPAAGFYHLGLDYFPDTNPNSSRGIEIETALTINGESPFSGAEAFSLPRIWGDGERTREKDNQGNEIRPKQVQKPMWESVSLSDELGYITTPYQFYFQEGENIIRFDAKQETLILRRLELEPIKELISYEEYIAGENKDSAKTDFHQRVEGEKAARRSSQSLYSTYDRSSAGTQPYDVRRQILNMGGGANWKIAGQWIEYEVEVPDDGLYELTLKIRQNYTRGFVSCRSLYINGEIPFEEASAIKFEFANDWQMMTLTDDNGDPYLFKLHKGVNQIRLQVTLGEIGNILTEMSDSVFRMNKIYRDILVLTGTEPDENRDYFLEEKIPNLLENLTTEYQVLYKIVDELVEYTGETGSQTASILTLATQIEKFVKKPYTIAKNLPSFKNNVSSLGTSILTMSESTLAIDYLIVSGTDYKIPDDSVSWFDRAKHEIGSFIASFVVDYNAIGDVFEESDDREVITVWVFAGRDQCAILKDMIDDEFVQKYGIGVNVELLAASVLLPATVAGTGPDVALGVASGEPVNYALRGASTDLTQFKGDKSKGILGFDELFSQYYESSYIPCKYYDEKTKHEGVYGLPETQYYNMMFYRTDIMEQLGLTPPQTWDELIAILPVIQKANMNVGIPSTERKINNVSNPDMNGFFAQLYQRNGTLYNEKGSKVMLDGDVAVEAFSYYTRFFTHYKTPTDYNFVDRFRTGEMPLGFVDFNTYNTLVVSAPEIRGLWEMDVLPGTVEKNADGTDKLDENGNPVINRSCGCWGVYSMLLNTSEHKEAAWTFMQWWGSADIQARYGRELEAAMGESARYATANKAAFEQLAWSADQREMLKKQWAYVVGTPEVAGGYYTSRHVVNATRKVMNNNEDPRETLLDYTQDINDELTKKRKEFGLSVED